MAACTEQQYSVFTFTVWAVDDEHEERWGEGVLVAVVADFS